MQASKQTSIPIPMASDGAPAAVAEELHASGQSSEKLKLSSLQSRMKCDPEGHESELLLLRNRFDSLRHIFEENSKQDFTSIPGIGVDTTAAKDLADTAMLLAHVAPFYPNHLVDFPRALANLLRSSPQNLPSGLRLQLAQALALLVNRKIVDVGETLSLFMKLQTLRDKMLKKLAFDHVVHSIRHTSKNRAKLQDVLFGMLKEEKDEKLASRALVTLCELHRRKAWFDERTANAICNASFHKASRVRIEAITFLLGYEKIENHDSDDSSNDDELTESPQVILSKGTIYKASYQGTIASKKKKKAKLQRIIRSMKKQQRLSSERGSNNCYSPLNHLKDAQGFAEKLFKCLQNCNERFEVRMMMLKLIARAVGLHQLVLLEFYPLLKKYIQPHHRDITNLLAAVVQACHDMVPPDAVKPLFKQIVNQFICESSRHEAITVGLNTVREVCMRMPLLMDEDLLQDLALYKKSHEKAVSAAARSLIALFRELCPSLLVKKDRGWPIDPKSRLKAYGEVNVETDVPGVELLQIIDNDDEHESDVSVCSGSDHDQENDQKSIHDDDENQLYSENSESDDDNEAQDNNDVLSDDEDETSSDYETGVSDDDVEEKEDVLEDGEQSDAEDGDVSEHEDDHLHTFSDDGSEGTIHTLKETAKKRKFSDFNGQLIVAKTSLGALKKLAGIKMGHDLPESKELGILSNEDFQRIKERKAKEEARNALAQHGLAKSALLKVHIRKKQRKDERLALVREGREERGSYYARTAVKHKKTGGLSNKQKEHKKNMPLSAKREKVARSQIAKKKKHLRSGKQFRGRKAWREQ